MSKKLETLREKEAALRARLQQIESQRKEISRKEDTRRKVLIGTVILNRIALGLESEETLRAWLDAGLTRNTDRIVFGLDLLPESQETQAPAKPDKSKKKAVVAAEQVVAGTVQKSNTNPPPPAAESEEAPSPVAPAESTKRQGSKKALPVSKSQKQLEEEFT